MQQISRVPTALDVPGSVRVRPRPRALDLDAPAAPEWETHLIAYAEANAQKNKYTREEGVAKKALERAMATARLDEVSKEVDGITYTATLKPGTADYIDVKELYGKVPLATFLEMVSISQKAVKDTCGTVVAAAVTKTKATAASLSLSKAAGPK